MTSLWERYGTITQAKLAENLTRMSSPWNPPQPIKDLFLLLNRGSQFASDGSEPIALSQVLRIYTLIANTGLFAEACREWRKIRDIDKNMDTLQVLFTEAEQDRSQLPAKRDTTPATPQPLSPLRLLRQPQPFHLRRNTHWPSHGRRHSSATGHGQRHSSATGHLDSSNEDPKLRPPHQQRHFLLLDTWSHHQQQPHQCLV